MIPPFLHVFSEPTVYAQGKNGGKLMGTRSSNDDRRGFLKKGAAGLGAMVMFPSAMQGESEKKAEEKEKKEKKAIVTRTLGKTGMELPVVSMGVGACDNPEVVRAALDAGIVHLDTAWGYSNGANETMIAEVVKDRPRESYVIGTKVPGEPEDRRNATYTKDAKAGPFLEKFEESLKRLKTDYVEILYLHSTASRDATLWDEYLTALQKAKEQGKARFVGVSTHRNEAEVIRAAAESKVYDVVLTAYNFRQPHVKEVKKAISEAAKAGLGIVAMKTQAGVYWDRERQRQINMKAALKWALLDENVHTAIPGMSTFDQMEENVSVMEDLKLSSEEKKDLDLGHNLGVPGLYCPQCGDCLAQCRKNLEIPTLMRSYMYAYGYKNLASAKAALTPLGLSDDPCAGCESCTVRCSMGFDVKSKVQDIARLRSLPWDFVA
jgi:predicted aldo/keto reductase-like oxidoreductase